MIAKRDARKKDNQRKFFGKIKQKDMGAEYQISPPPVQCAGMWMRMTFTGKFLNAIASRRNSGRSPVRLAMAAARPGGTGLRQGLDSAETLLRIAAKRRAMREAFPPRWRCKAIAFSAQWNDRCGTFGICEQLKLQARLHFLLAYYGTENSPLTGKRRFAIIRYGLET